MSELAVGPELDAEVARLMGWRQVEGLQVSWWAPVGYWLRPGETDLYPVGRKEPLPYSTSIEAAWTVVERLRKLGAYYCKWDIGQVPGGWSVAVAIKRETGSTLEHGYGYADEAPEAICRAALRALSRPPGAAALEAVQDARGLDSGDFVSKDRSDSHPADPGASDVEKSC